MIKFLQKNSLFLSPLFLLLAFAPACVNMDKTLGENFIPDYQQLKVEMDTASFFTFQTVELDSLRTDNFSEGVLGKSNVLGLGTTTAGFVAQFYPDAYDFPDSGGITQFDSVFLQLTFTSAYGKNATNMKIIVRELNTDINDSTAYYGNRSFANSISKSEVIGSATFNVDTFSVYIKLDNVDNLYERLMSRDKEAFFANFKGLYVSVDTTDGDDGCIQYVSLVNTIYEYAQSAMVGYTHKADADTLALPYVFYVDSYTPRFNVYDHHYTGSLQMNDENAPFFAAKGLGGVGIQVTFDTTRIRAWVNSKVKNNSHLAVNRVELILPVEDSSDGSMVDLYARQLSCKTKRNGAYYFTRDVLTYTSSGYTLNSAFDGYINRSQMRYSLNITHFFNEILKGLEDGREILPMLIVPYNHVYDASSVVVSNAPTRRSQLKITYGEIK